MKKFTDEQIIKALEYCSTDVRENTCPKCAFYKKHRCSTLMLNAVSDLINRQKAEIERLNKDCEDVIYKLEYLLCNATGNKFSKHTYPIGDMVSYVNGYIQDCCNEAVEEAKEAIKFEAIKEFAHLVIDRSRNGVICASDVPDLLKEMTEER